MRPARYFFVIQLSNSRIGSELLQVSEVSHKSWSLTIRLVIKRLRNKQPPAMRVRIDCYTKNHLSEIERTHTIEAVQHQSQF